MDGHKHTGLSDEMLEREIEAAFGVDPSPEFLPRIRARIASEQVHQTWFWSTPWRWAGAVAVVTGVVVIAVWSLRDPVPAPREAHMSTPTAERARNAPDSPGLQDKTRPTLAASADSPVP